MELPELKEIIERALKVCEDKLVVEPEIVLSEADFERLVCWSIMRELGQTDYEKPKPGDFTVHTQVSHYMDGENRPDYRVDILLLTKEGMKNAKGNHMKGYKYMDDSFALELKYYHANDSVSKIRKSRCDFCKREDLDNNSWLYIVTLIESNDEDDYYNKKAIIDVMKDNMVDGNPYYEQNLFNYVMRKREVDWNQSIKPQKK